MSMKSSRPPRPSAIAEPRDRDLVRSYWPAKLKPAFDALFGIEDALADVVTVSTQPALAAIKLAWWRERLQELDQGRIPAEPRLEAAARTLLPRGISGADLAELEGGWAALLDERPDMALFNEHGSRLFALGARLLGVRTDDAIEAAGKLFAEVDASRRGLAVPAHSCPPADGLKIDRRARPLTGLAALAARDARSGPSPFEREATPGRAWTLLLHRLTGRIG